MADGIEAHSLISMHSALSSLYIYEAYEGILKAFQQFLIPLLLSSRIALSLNMYKCVKCNSRFFTKNSMKSHNKSKHSSLEFICGTCLNKFSARGDLADHNCKDPGTPNFCLFLKIVLRFIIIMFYCLLKMLLLLIMPRLMGKLLVLVDKLPGGTLLLETLPRLFRALL